MCLRVWADWVGWAVGCGQIESVFAGSGRIKLAVGRLSVCLRA